MIFSSLPMPVLQRYSHFKQAGERIEWRRDSFEDKQKTQTGCLPSHEQRETYRQIKHLSFRPSVQLAVIAEREEEKLSCKYAEQRSECNTINYSFASLRRAGRRITSLEPGPFGNTSAVRRSQ